MEVRCKHLILPLPLSVSTITAERWVQREKKNLGLIWDPNQADDSFVQAVC